MFTQEQKKNNTQELQQLLYEIAHYNRRIPLIIPDGIFGPETEETVKAFQREYGLPQTGSADPDTWDKIAEINRFFFSKPFVIDIFDSDTIIIPGEAGPLLQIIQVMLGAVARKYRNLPPIPVSGIYDGPTERAVTEFKKSSNHSGVNDGIDREFWNNLVALFNRIVI